MTNKTYDGLNRATSIDVVSSSGTGTLLSSYDIKYDAVGNVRQSVEEYQNASLNRTVTMQYDNANRLTEETISGNGAGSITYAYDKAHNREQMIKDGVVHSYAYNSLNQLLSWSRSGTTTSYQFDHNGNRVAEITSSGTKQLWYDIENRLIGYNTPAPILAASGSTTTSGSAPILGDKHTQGAELPGTGPIPPGGMVLGNGIVYPPRSGPFPANVHPSWGDENPADMYWVSATGDVVGLQWVWIGGPVFIVGAPQFELKEYRKIWRQDSSTRHWMDYKDEMSGQRPHAVTTGIYWDYQYLFFDPWNYGAPQPAPVLNEPSPGNGTLFTYDYRTRRVRLKTATADTKFVFSGGVSVKEFENGGTTPSVEYVRGSDWGGGVGGILYTLRSGTASFTHYNHRGDVTAKTSVTGSLTYQSTYEAFGKRTAEVGSTPDREKSNTKPEDLPGYANEGFRFRDLETGVFLTRDPLGFVDGPNMYTYVVQNPWTKFDPRGLSWQERLWGAGKFVVGTLEAVVGIGIGTGFSVTVAGAVAGAVITVHGADTAGAGLRQMWTGESERTMTSYDLQRAGLNEQQAEMADSAIGFAGGLAGTANGVIRAIPIVEEGARMGLKATQAVRLHDKWSKALPDDVYNALGGNSTTPLEKMKRAADGVVSAANTVGYHVGKACDLANTGLTPLAEMLSGGVLAAWNAIDGAADAQKHKQGIKQQDGAQNAQRGAPIAVDNEDASEDDGDHPKKEPEEDDE